MWKEKETDVVFEEVRDSKAEGNQTFQALSLVKVPTNQKRMLSLSYGTRCNFHNSFGWTA